MIPIKDTIFGILKSRYNNTNEYLHSFETEVHIYNHHPVSNTLLCDILNMVLLCYILNNL